MDTEKEVLATMTTPIKPSVLNDFRGSWECQFYDDFTDATTLSRNYFHPFGDPRWRENPANKWKWDAVSHKEIHWDFTCSSIINDAEGSRLRTCVYSDWFHRIDRLATKQLFGYGYYEAKVRFKGAEGMHASFWLLPDSIDDSRVYPAGTISGGIEVDVVEHRLKDGSRRVIDHIGNTSTHWSGYGKNHQSAAYKEINLPRGSQQWCTYGVLHEASGIKWYWDGRLVNQTIVNSPTPAHMYFSTEVNESGGWAGTDMSSYGPRSDPAGYIECSQVSFWSKVAGVTLGSSSNHMLQTTKDVIAKVVNKL